MAENRVELFDEQLENVAGGYLAWNKNADGSGEIWIYHIDADGNKVREGRPYPFKDGHAVEVFISANRSTMGDKTILGNLYKMGLIS